MCVPLKATTVNLKESIMGPVGPAMGTEFVCLHSGHEFIELWPNVAN